MKIDISQAYFHIPISQNHRRYLSLSYQGTLYEMTCLPFGLASAPSAFAKTTNWVAHQLRQTKGPSRNSLFGRFSFHPRGCPNTRAPNRIRDQIPRGTGMASEPKEVVLKSSDRGRISGDHLGYSKKCEASFVNKGHPTENVSFKPFAKGPMELARCQDYSREIQLRIIRLTFGPTPLPSFTKSLTSFTARDSASKDTYIGNGSGRINVVDGKRTPIFSHSSPGSVVLHHNRRRRHRLGCNCEQLPHGRKLDIIPTKMAQQFERTMDGVRGPATIGSRNTREDCDVANGQSNERCLHFKTRGHKVRRPTQSRDKNPSALRAQKLSPNRPSHPGAIQWNSRRTIEGEGSSRMASQQRKSYRNFSEIRNTGDRSLCVEKICSCLGICERGCNRLSQSVHGRIQQKVGVQVGMDFPSSGSDSTDSPTPTDVRRPVPPRRPNMGQSLLGTRSPSKGSRTTSSNTGLEVESNRSADKSTTPGGREPKVGGLEGSGWAKCVRGWSSSELELLGLSWRKSTLKTYKPVWSRWCNWAQENKIPIDNPDAQAIAKYLCYLYRTVKLAPRTIALHKSVVINFGNPLHADKLTSHPLIKQVVKGIFADKPPTRKPISWDIQNLIGYLNSYQFDDGSIFAVSRHTCILLLLASGRRVHDLTLLSLKHGAFEDKGDCIIFWPKFGSKTDSATYQQSGWLLKKGSENEGLRLDLYYWIKKLIAVSASRRQHFDNLFVTTRGTVKGASRTVIAGWIRSLFKDAGISASAGSFRAAVATDNWISNKFSIDEILQRGNWRTKNTFFKHYFKEVINPAQAGSSNNQLSNSFAPIN